MKISKYFFAFFALFVIFADELFGCYMAVTGTELVSGMKSRMAIIISAITLLLFIIDMANKRISKQNWKELMMLAVLLVLYVITGFIYPHNAGNYDRYYAYLLVYGATCVPAAYVGIRLAREQAEDELIRLLPYFVIFISLVTFYLVRNSSLAGVVLQSDENGTFSYQSASYFLSFCYSYCLFYVFLKHTETKENVYEKVKKIVLSVLLFVCGIGCILGGGRGAFVYIVVITIYLVYRIFKMRGRHHTLTVLILAVAGVLMVYFLSRFQVFQSAGYQRVSETLTTDYNRTELWKQALQAFYRSPVIGNGIGSIWWTVGYYSHNIATDLLSEIGVIGTIIIAGFILEILRYLIKHSSYSNLEMFLMLMFIGHLTECAFSGYWLASPALFLAFGYVYAHPKSNRR